MIGHENYNELRSIPPISNPSAMGHSACSPAPAVMRFLARLLLAFHVWLFVADVAQGALADPGIVIRWLIAVGLLMAVVELQRRGESLVGRKAIVVWLLAGMLHGPALLPSQATVAPPSPQALVVVFESVVLGIGLGLLLLSTRPRVQFRPAITSIARSFQPGVAGVRSVLLSPSTGPRPPPHV